MYYFWFFFFHWEVVGENTFQRMLLTLCSRVTHGSLGEPYRVLENHNWWAECKARVVPTVLSISLEAFQFLAFHLRAVVHILIPIYIAKISPLRKDQFTLLLARSKTHTDHDFWSLRTPLGKKTLTFICIPLSIHL